MVTWSLDLMMLTALTVYVACQVGRRSGTRFQRFGPLLFTVVGSLMILLDPLRHVVADMQYAATKTVNPILREYKSNCPSEGPKCLTATGWIVTIFCTYCGFFLFLFGTFWNANLMGKLRELRAKWREIRS